MKHNFGLYKSPYDTRDYLLQSFLGYKTLPLFYDITSKMTPVRSQQNEGSCVGFATVVGVKEYQELIDCNKLVELSPRYVYEEAKKISGHTEGTTLKAAMEVVTKMGVCEERIWPYKPKDAGEKSQIADGNAAKYKVKSYARIIDIDDLKQSILELGATLVGVLVYKTFINDKARKTGVVDNPSCFDRMNVLGGHAICACGYDDRSLYFKNDGHIKFKNSWGKEWGLDGYGFISYAYAKKNMMDAFSCVDIEGSESLVTVASLPKKGRYWV